MTDDEDGKGWCSAVDALHHAMDVAVKKCHERYCVIINDPRIFLASFSFVYARETLIRLTAGPSPASQLGPRQQRRVDIFQLAQLAVQRLVGLEQGLMLRLHVGEFPQTVLPCRAVSYRSE